MQNLDLEAEANLDRWTTGLKFIETMFLFLVNKLLVYFLLMLFLDVVN